MARRVDGPYSVFACIMASAAIGLALSVPAKADGEVAGDELKRLIAGRRVYLAVPLGGEFPLHYQADGRVDGTGEAIGLGRFLKPTDSGHWWVHGAQLCQKWESWYDGKVFCFTIRRESATRIAWRRGDGYAGTARLGE
jgi:hypothetical protein